MPVQVAAALHLVLLAVNFHRVRLHDFLHRLTDIAQPHVDPGRSDPGFCRLVHRLQQRVVHVVERLRERAVDDASFHLNPKVEFDDVVLIDHALAPPVRRPMRGDVIFRATRRKRHPSLQPALLDQLPHAIFQRLAHVDVLHPGFHPIGNVLPHLSMHLRALPRLVVQILFQPLQLSLLLVRLAPQIMLVMRQYLPRRILRPRVQLAHGRRRRPRLFLPARVHLIRRHRRRRFLLLFLLLLLLRRRRRLPVLARRVVAVVARVVVVVVVVRAVVVARHPQRLDVVRERLDVVALGRAVAVAVVAHRRGRARRDVRSIVTRRRASP